MVSEISREACKFRTNDNKSQKIAFRVLGLDTELKFMSVITFLRTIVLKLSARLLLARLATSSTFSDCKVHVSVPICLRH